MAEISKRGNIPRHVFYAIYEIDDKAYNPFASKYCSFKGNDEKRNDIEWILGEYRHTPSCYENPPSSKDLLKHLTSITSHIEALSAFVKPRAVDKNNTDTICYDFSVKNIDWKKLSANDEYAYLSFSPDLQRLLSALGEGVSGAVEEIQSLPPDRGSKIADHATNELLLDLERLYKQLSSKEKKEKSLHTFVLEVIKLLPEEERPEISENGETFRKRVKRAQDSSH